MDACLLTDNLYYIKVREGSCKKMPIAEITRTRTMSDEVNIIYFSAKKFRYARGRTIVTNNHELFREMQQIGVYMKGLSLMVE